MVQFSTIIKLRHSLSQIVQKNLFVIWLLFILLTAAILLFPFQLHYEYQVIGSASVFGENLPLFGPLYYIWFAILLLLLFSNGGQNSRQNELQRLALLCIFGVVFFGIWTINTPFGDHHDIPWQFGHINYILQTGKIVLNNSNLDYFQFPGFAILNSIISRCTGLGLIETRTLFMLFSGAIFVLLLYVLFLKALKNSYYSSLAVLLIIQGSLINKTQEFWPGNLGLIFLVVILVLLYKRENKQLETPMSITTLATIILLGALTITYLPWSIFLIFLLPSIYLMQKLPKKSIVNSLIIVLFIAIFLGWETYSLTNMFNGVVGMIPKFLAGLANPAERLFSQSLSNNLNAATPLWVNFTRFFWYGLLYGFGLMLWIWNIVKVKKLSFVETLETGGLIGVVVFSIFSFFTYNDQWFRFLQLSALFVVPILLRFLVRLSNINGLSNNNKSVDSRRFFQKVVRFAGCFRRHVFLSLFIMLLVLSLPVLLMYNAGLCTNTVYSYDHAIGGFVISNYGSNQLDIFTTESTKILLTGYLPDDSFHFSIAPQLVPNRTELWQNMNYLVNDFEAKSSNAIFVLSEKFRLPTGDPASIQPSDPKWVEFTKRLANNNLVYTNRHIEIYTPYRIGK